MTFDDLVGENAFVVMGQITRLLRQLERSIPELKGLANRYREEAIAGDYEGLLRVSHRYALEYAQSTLAVRPDFDSYMEVL